MEYNFVNDLSEEFTCQVCMKLLNEPQLTDCCGQHFCRACLNHWFQEKGKKQCPHCCSETFTYIPYLPLKRKINELKVYCPNQTKGCGVVMKLEELENHLSSKNDNGCGYVTINCPKKMCRVSCLRKDLENHTSNECSLRIVTCTYCGMVGKYCFITSKGRFKGHIIYCPEYPVDCPRSCGTVRNLKRKDLEAHKEVCPLEPVECPFHEAGCVQKGLVRKDLDRHIQSRTQQHLLNLMDTNKALLSKNKELQSTIADVASELGTVLQHADIRGSIKRSLEKIQTTFNRFSLQLEKEGDQLTFKIPEKQRNWKQRVYINDITLSIVLSQTNPPTFRESILGGNDSDIKLSLIILSGELDGKHEITCDWNEFSVVGPLCAKCTKQKSSKNPEAKPPGLQEIEHMILRVSILSDTSVVKVTLAKHNCKFSGTP